MNEICFRCGSRILLRHNGKHRFTFPPNIIRCKVFEGSCGCGENYGHVVPPEKEEEYRSSNTKVNQDE